jgi:hypothetical protein
LPVRRTSEELPAVAFQGLIARCKPAHPSEGLVAVQDLAIRSTAVHTGKVSFEKQSISLFRSAQRFFGLLSVGYVTQKAFQVKQGRPLEDANAELLDPTPLACPALEAVE